MLALFVATLIHAAEPNANASVDAIYSDIEALYIDLHKTPELSQHEEKTGEKMALRLKKLGFKVTSHVGGYGVVGILENGAGPTLMLRTDLDGLPVEEKTGLPYASKVKASDADGRPVSVMHACGHDVHMSTWIAVATLLSRTRDRWQGTLMMVGQPAEEKGGGAVAMLKDGLFTRFPKPTFAIALHDSAELPAGKVGYVSGYALANVSSVDVTFFGRGGHGAYPHTTVDPIVMAARSIMGFQTIVARETNPLDPAVVTVGSIHGGTKHNIIPDEVHLQMTVRSYKETVHQRLLDAIARIAKAEAMASGASKEPKVTVSEGTPATYNDPALTARVAGAMRKSLGEGNVMEMQPVMGAEDFSEYGRAGVPAVMFWVGAVDPEAMKRALAGGAAVSSLHSATFAPDRERTLRTAMTALSSAAMEILAKK